MTLLSDNIDRKFQDIIDIDDGWEIETDTGFQPISKIMKTIPYEEWELILEDGSELKAADNHIVFTENMEEIFVKDLKVNDLVQTKNGLKKVISCTTNHDYEEMYDIEVNSEDHRFYTGNILSHNTTCAAAYILWLTVMAPKEKKQTILVTANKLSQAQEILDRIKYSYGQLPRWLVPGIIKNNERSMTFDNGSRILCRATTTDAGRGLSPTLVYIDEMAFIKKSIAAAFITAIKPTLATGGKMFITSTPMNDEDEFAKIWNGAINEFDDNGNKIPNGVGRNGFFPLKFIWSDHPDRDDKWAIKWKSSLGEARFRQEFEVQFVSSDETLIDSTYIADRLKGRPEIYRIGESRWFKDPIPNHVYAVALDPSMGTGGDAAAIEVFDLTTMEQVAEWKSSITPTIKQVKMLRNILFNINSTMNESPLQKGEPEIYWSFENNACGEGTLVAIELMGLENFPGTLVTDSIGKRKGLTTDNRSKMTACSVFKRLVEKNRFHINSEPLIAELKNFIAYGAGYAAKIGEHDDLVMTTLMIIKIYNIVSRWEDNVAQEDDVLDDMEEITIEPMPIAIL